MMGGQRTMEYRSAIGLDVARGVVAGLIGGGIFGLVLHMLGEIAVVGHLVGTRTERLAWITLLVIGVLGAVAYYQTVRKFPLLQVLATEPRTGVALGLAFGILLWFVAIVAVPLWVVLYGITSTVPYVHVPSLIGLVVYGAIVGGLVPFVTKHRRYRRYKAFE